jgi:hypothetical protein
VAFAAIGLYLLATAFSATDEDLLLDRTLAISQLSAQIPATVSFAMMPILFVALHVFTLIRYDMLAANVNQFREDLMVLVPEKRDRERCRQLLANVEFIQALTAPPGSALRSRLFGFVAWMVIAAFPVIVLLAASRRKARHSVSLARDATLETCSVNSFVAPAAARLDEADRSPDRLRQRSPYSSCITLSRLKRAPSREWKPSNWPGGDTPAFVADIQSAPR